MRHQEYQYLELLENVLERGDENQGDVVVLVRWHQYPATAS